MTTAGYATALCEPWLNQIYEGKAASVSGPIRDRAWLLFGLPPKATREDIAPGDTW